MALHEDIKERIIAIEIAGPIKKGIFRRRVNRFVAEVFVGGSLFLAHVPSSGRMAELLYPGAEVNVVPVNSKKKKLVFKLVSAKQKNSFVSVDSLVPNRLIALALDYKALPEFRNYNRVVRESSFRKSRFDFYLTGDNSGCFIEVKSVTLVEKGVALFPDAPSSRGRKHLQELIEAKKKGFRACVIFVIQREDALYFKPNDSRDAEFAYWLRKAKTLGVEVFAYDCKVDAHRIVLNNKLPVKV